MTDTVMMLVCVCKQAAIKMISDGLYTPLLYDSLSLSLPLSHTHKPHTVADSEAPDCHSKVRITSSPRFTKRSSIKCVVITSGLCCSVVSNLNDI